MVRVPEQRVLRALASLIGNTDFDIVVDYLKGEMVVLEKSNRVMKDEVQLRMQQGALQTLEEFLTHTMTADKTLHDRATRPVPRSIAGLEGGKGNW